MKTLEFSVNTPAILKEVANHYCAGADTDSPGMVMSMNEIRVGLARIAQRAIELDDHKLLAELRRLGCVNPS